MSNTVKGYKPHDKQREIHNSINSEDAKYYVLCIGRQWGKTLLCINQLLYWAINSKGCNIGWVSPIYKQSKKVYNDLKKATQKSGYFSYNDSELIVKGFDSQITFYSAERPDNIRGNTFDFLVLDEFDFMKNNTWEEVLQPTVLVRGKKVVFISTPKGKRMMYKLSLLRHQDDRYRFFRFSSYDNPMIDPREIDSIRTNVPEHIFRQEYLAEFIDGASGLFKNVRECIGKASPSGKLYGGLDIGRADDYTVLTVGDRNGAICHVERWRHDDWSNIIDKVAKVIRQYNCGTFVEINNQGDVFFEMLQKKVGNLAHPFTTTSKSKPIMIEDLAVSFEQMELTIPDEEYLIDELEAFTYVFDPKSRAVKYSAPEGIHDDTVMSMALYNQARKNLPSKGKYFASI
jgi:hypothetical protein